VVTHSNYPCFSRPAESSKDQSVYVAQLNAAALLDGEHRKLQLSPNNAVLETCVWTLEHSGGWVLVQDYIFSTAKEKQRQMEWDVRDMKRPQNSPFKWLIDSINMSSKFCKLDQLCCILAP